MVRGLINFIEIIVIAKVLWNIGRYFMGKKKHKTIMGKVTYLVSRRIHRRLDKAIQMQKELDAAPGNVIQFRKVN